MDPDFQIEIVWANTWIDPELEGRLAEDLVAAGADILVQNTDSDAPLKVAARHGILAFGQSADQIASAPEHQATSIVDNWAPYYVERTRAVLDGDWTSQDTWGGLGSGMVRMAPYRNLPPDVVAMATATEAELASGRFYAFSGPIRRQDGTLVIGEGEVLEDAVLLTMDWFVEGIGSSPP